MAEEMSGYAASLERAEAGSQPEGVEVVTGVRIDAATGKLVVVRQQLVIQGGRLALLGKREEAWTAFPA